MKWKSLQRKRAVSFQWNCTGNPLLSLSQELKGRMTAVPISKPRDPVKYERRMNSQNRTDSWTSQGAVGPSWNISRTLLRSGSLSDIPTSLSLSLRYTTSYAYSQMRPSKDPSPPCKGWFLMMSAGPQRLFHPELLIFKSGAVTNPKAESIQ